MEIEYLKNVLEKAIPEHPSVRKLLIAYYAALREYNLLLEVLSEHPQLIREYFQRTSSQAEGRFVLLTEGLEQGIPFPRHEDIVFEIERLMHVQKQCLENYFKDDS